MEMGELRLFVKEAAIENRNLPTNKQTNRDRMGREWRYFIYPCWKIEVVEPVHIDGNFEDGF